MYTIRVRLPECLRNVRRRSSSHEAASERQRFYCSAAASNLFASLRARPDRHDISMTYDLPGLFSKKLQDTLPACQCPAVRLQPLWWKRFARDQNFEQRRARAPCGARPDRLRASSKEIIGSREWGKQVVPGYRVRGESRRLRGMPRGGFSAGMERSHCACASFRGA